MPRQMLLNWWRKPETFPCWDVDLLRDGAAAPVASSIMEAFGDVWDEDMYRR